MVCVCVLFQILRLGIDGTKFACCAGVASDLQKSAVYRQMKVTLEDAGGSQMLLSSVLVALAAVAIVVLM